ncbi:MAG: sigma-70 family RNA polymerase sigma factor [Candidatus Omnitrophica bacterium]|jgi:RNA polymerase sigma factor (sigma-70 family)|nr:sigma-70 family RNA polymerase sigma factor [Candidatus Omnitrophota bacterium]MDD5079545.1 sigma-70 family RNA polymerase sigma factor [Candidatus Omnitrophota bacterium]
MDAYDKLLKRLTPKLKGITYKLNSYLSCADHDDLFQEALLHLWLEFNSGKLVDKTDSYILQGCYFYLRNHIRKAGDKICPLSLDFVLAGEKGEELQPGLYLKDGTAENFRDELNDKLLADTIMNNGLTEREKKLLPFLAEGLTLREIGENLGISHVMVIKMTKVIREKCRKHTDRF